MFNRQKRAYEAEEREIQYSAYGQLGRIARLLVDQQKRKEQRDEYYGFSYTVPRPISTEDFEGIVVMRDYEDFDMNPESWCGPQQEVAVCGFKKPYGTIFTAEYSTEFFHRARRDYYAQDTALLKGIADALEENTEA